MPGLLTRLRPHSRDIVAVLALFAAVAAGCGWLWFQLWSQPVGTVHGHEWFTDEEGLRNAFDGVAWYVVLAAGGGALAGAVAALLGRRAPSITMGAVVVGSALAAWVMLQTGLSMSPADPEVLARTAADGTELRGRISLEGAWSPFLAWPFGALIALMVMNFLLSSREEIQAREAGDPRWLSRNHPG